MQRDTGNRPAPMSAGWSGPGDTGVRVSLPGSLLAPGTARRLVRAAVAEWTGCGLLDACSCADGPAGGCPPGTPCPERLADDAALVAGELVTNAVVHAGTAADLVCRYEQPAPDTDDAADEPAALIIEVSDHHPDRPVHSHPHGFDQSGTPDYGRGLHLVAALAERWGITYRAAVKTVWARLPLDGRSSRPRPGDEPVPLLGPRPADGAAAEAPAPGRDDHDWLARGGAASFLAEASDLLAGQLDENMVAALAGQLLVPRLADWCAVWLDDETGWHGRREAGRTAAAPRLAGVWHRDESAVEQLRAALGTEAPKPPDPGFGGPVVVPWPGTRQDGDPVADGGGAEDTGAALAYRLAAGGRGLGVLVVAQQDTARLPDEVTALVEDFTRRVALAISAAREYTRQATISRVLQRGLLPSKVGQIPGVDTCLVYEPSGDGVAGGDFYDVFPAGSSGRWCFVLGDVQGSGPEAAVVTGLARPWLRLLAREGYQVGQVLDRLNGLLLDDAMEAAEAAALLVTGGHGPGLPDGQHSRFLSLLYGEVVPSPDGRGGARCTLASAGHPLPLLLRPDGTVTVIAEPQVLLGVVDDVAYQSSTFDLAPGETLLCVTDGVTERRSGPRMFDDEDGLAAVLAGCAGLSAKGVAERIRAAVHAFAQTPPGDDLALLVLQAG
ncbi:SpoIIE family protein phosphatase [Streptomyces sp. NPDC015127]|uniref:SpoIIE family protein phosphatase n=1 Tax=Streptomyces sp. NPDC015127 TaxID=3364939 RepID=UPI0036FE6812